jgi:hypothetical protein
MEQTTLQKIQEHKAEQMRTAIVEAIEDGAEFKKITQDMYSVGGIIVWQNLDNTFSVVLKFASDKVAKIFEPSKDDLEQLAEQKRRELEEIENQIKERAKE